MKKANVVAPEKKIKLAIERNTVKDIRVRTDIHAGPLSNNTCGISITFPCCRTN